MVDFSEVHAGLSPDIVKKAAELIEWIDNTSNYGIAIAVNDFLYELEQEVFRVTVEKMSDESG
jgi:hypothetical protein